MKNLQKAKNGNFYLRLVIPSDVRCEKGSFEILLTLKTKDVTKAEFIARPLIEYYQCLLIFCRTKGLKMFWNKEFESKEDDIKLNFYSKLSIGELSLEIKTEQEDKKDIIDLLKTVLISNETKQPVIKTLDIKNSPLINYYFDDYLKSIKQRNLSKATIEKKETSLKKLKWMLDDKTRISDINADLVRRIIKILFAMPDVSIAKYSVDEALDLGLPGRSYIACTAECRAVSSYFDWLVNEGHLEQNPFLNIKLPKPPKILESRSYISFTHEDLEQIFNERLVEDAKQFPEFYWLPVLGLYTGARLNEIFQLTINDVFLDAPVPYIDINNNNGKTIKNRSSIRKIPIHPKLFELKFDEYVNAIKNDKQTKLFSSESPFSRHFRAYTSKVGITDKKKVFHSFRHGFISELQLNHVSLEIRQALAGHTPKTITESVYGTSVSLEDLYEGIKTLDFKLDIPILENTKAHSRLRKSK